MDYDDQNIFAQILHGEIPADKVYENEDVLAFRDVQPQAPVHILVIPKHPLASLADARDGAVLGELMLAVGEIARQEGFADDGFRVVINNGQRANQTVFHLHMHLVGGRQLKGLG